MSGFEEEYKKLNKDQKEAVDSTEGPVMVLAGPGTGKTQLLAMRAANILRKNDVPPSAVLCLTFTDNAARNMRERLAEIIGQSAYHVAIYTFHSFGTDIINNYPDYFTKRQLIQQVDELGQYELLQGIFEKLPHENPLSTKVGDQFIHLKSTLNLIGWLKQNALSHKELSAIITANQDFMDEISNDLTETFVNTPAAKQLPQYEKLLGLIEKKVTGKKYFGFPEYAAECGYELRLAIEETDPSGRHAKYITSWRNKWCAKDSSGRFVFKDSNQNLLKMRAVTEIYKALDKEMVNQGLYDFDDMVVEAVHAMETDDELRYNLQERYQYILVDEFQDTNKAQLRMLIALGDNPVHENRPNIMTVGDDDQAIYSFQGAEVSNMRIFTDLYTNPKIISLSENYRSNARILEASQKISSQINERLSTPHLKFGERLSANKKHEIDIAEHLAFTSELAQYEWISTRISELIKSGVKVEEIAVIAPRHRYLERLMPYLGNKKIPVAYERRENILEAPIIKQLIKMSGLITAISENRQDDIDSLISEILGYDFWALAPEELMEISLQAYDKHKHWLPILTSHKNKKIRQITRWFITLSKNAELEPMEYILDQLIGHYQEGKDSEYDEVIQTHGHKAAFTSPFRAYYFNDSLYENATDIYLSLLGQLSTLRQRLRLWKPNKTIYIKDLVEFSALHMSAGIKIVDTNPHTQTTSAVQVMTAYKAKGLEFEAVFVINAQDEVWGPTARSRPPGIALPKNLPIEPAGNSDDDRLRLFFVALTRAKHTLYITSYEQTLENKPSPKLSFLMDTDEEEPLHPVFSAKVIDKPSTAKEVEILSTDWAYRFRQVIADKKSLFEPILNNYKLSVTHLNNFLDVVDGGPEYFFIHNLLRFPEAVSPSAAYGDSMHKTLQWVQIEFKKNGNLPDYRKITDYFEDILERKHLRKSDHKRLSDRGKKALEVYLRGRGSSISAADMVERGFNNEGVIIHGASLSGKIDKLHFQENGTAEVIDLKTGKPAVSWQGKDEYEKIKLHKYRQQLLFYKLLVENSASFKGRLSVNSGYVEFIETGGDKKLSPSLELVYDAEEIDRFILLIQAVWKHITSLDFPDVSGYPKNLKGILQFENDLISESIQDNAYSK